ESPTVTKLGRDAPRSHPCLFAFDENKRPPWTTEDFEGVSEAESNPRRRFATRCRLAHPSAGGDFRGRWLPIRDRAIGPPKEPDWTVFLRNLGDPSGFPRIKFHPKTWPSIGPQLAVTKVEVFREMRLVARTGARHFHQNRSREASARVNQCCCRHRTSKMRYQPNVMGLAESRELQKLRNAARVRQSHAR